MEMVIKENSNQSHISHSHTYRKIVKFHLIILFNLKTKGKAMQMAEGISQISGGECKKNK